MASIFLQFVSILLEDMVTFFRDGVTTEDIGTKSCTLDISDVCGESAAFVDLYS